MSDWGPILFRGGDKGGEPAQKFVVGVGGYGKSEGPVGRRRLMVRRGVTRLVRCDLLLNALGPRGSQGGREDTPHSAAAPRLPHCMDLRPASLGALITARHL